MVYLCIFLGILSLFFAALNIFLAVRIKKLKDEVKLFRDQVYEERSKATEWRVKCESTEEKVKELNDKTSSVNELEDENDSLKNQIDLLNLLNGRLEQEKSGALEALKRYDAVEPEVVRNYETAKAELSELLEKLKVVREENAAAEDESERLEKALKVLNNAYEVVLKRCDSVASLHKEAIVRSWAEIQGNWRTLRFSERELVELTQLKDVLILLSNAAPLNKAIYEMYYRDKIKELQAQLGVDKRRSGIYRLWMVMDDGIELSYVGQSVDIGERWVQHLKRFVGSEPATGIRLYKDDRVDLSKLRWEVIEFVEEKDLNEREKYWIEFYNCGGGWNSRV